jgi:hypothetical protein
MSHCNAQLAPVGRMFLVQRVRGDVMSMAHIAKKMRGPIRPSTSR